MTETAAELAARLGVQDARYRHDTKHRCEACRKLADQIVLVTGRVQTRGPNNPRGAAYRSRQVCVFCLPKETPWPGGVVALDTVAVAGGEQ